MRFKNPVLSLSLLALSALAISFVAFSASSTSSRVDAAPPVAADDETGKEISTRNHIRAVAAASPVLKLASQGRALWPVVIAEGASPKTRESAQFLAEYLGQISGATFEVEEGNGKTGLAVGTSADFGFTPGASTLKSDDITQREDYILLTHAKGAYLVGTTDLAVSHAVRDFLYRLGYRQFFPTKKWEVVPRIAELKMSVNAREHPDYLSRRIWFTYSTWPENIKDMDAWNVNNRMAEGVKIDTSHSYERIINANKAAFAAHPEYFSTVDGKRTNKFNVANPGLRHLVVEHALRFFEANPDADSISVDPSDGGGWGESKAEKALGSISDRVTLLANEVAEAVSKKYPGKYVGMYAYNQHAPPPSIRVHPRVVVNVATAFITGGYSVDELLKGWQNQGATIGIREYYSIPAWDKDMPRSARASDPAKLSSSISHFYQMGARFMSAESSDNWGPHGLSYYLASRILWDARESTRRDELVADFLDKSFGNASAAMAEYYKLLQPDPNLPMGQSHIGRMYRALDNALQASDDEAAVRARIFDLVLYTRFVELYTEYDTSKGAERQKGYEAVIRFSYRIRRTHMVHSLGFWRDLAKRDRLVKGVEGAGWKDSEPKNPWKSSEPFTLKEIANFLKAGIASNNVIETQRALYSGKLVSATPLDLPAVKQGSFGQMFRSTNHFYTWLSPQNQTLKFNAQAGMIYANKGDAKFYLYAEEEAKSPPDASMQTREVAKKFLAPDKTQVPVTLSSPKTGLHRLMLSDGKAGTIIDWPQGVPLTMEMSPGTMTWISSRWTLYFYVPKGTKTVGGYGGGVGTINDGSGKVRHTFGKDDFFDVPVPPGEDGTLWSFNNGAGTRQLTTVPPYLARSGEELLLPAEVVAADR